MEGGHRGGAAYVSPASRVEARVLYVRLGSLNPGGPWHPHPENRHPYVMEHLADKDIPRAKMVLDAAAQKAGAMWQKHPGGG